MPESTNPAADNSLEYKVAELQRQIANLASVGSEFKTGDYLFSEVTHPLMVGSTLSDGGRAGWWLMNGATFTSADDPQLFALRGSTTLPDFQDRVVGVPGSTNAAWLSTGAAALSGTSGAEAAHTHTNSNTDTAPDHAHTVPTTDGPNATTVVQSGTGVTVASSGHAHGNYNTGTGGTHAHSVPTTGAGSSHSHSLSGSTIQPTRFCGTAWIKR